MAMLNNQRVYIYIYIPLIADTYKSVNLVKPMVTVTSGIIQQSFEEWASIDDWLINVDFPWLLMLTIVNWV